jgi:hypothetical protein
MNKQDAIIKECSKLINKINNGKIKSRYSHDIIISEKELYLDCSTLVVFILTSLKETEAISEIKHFSENHNIKHNRLFCWSFLSFFKELKEKQITSTFWETPSFKDIKQGDIFTYQSTEKTDEKNHHRHIFIILDKLSNDIFKIIHSSQLNGKDGICEDLVKIVNDNIFYLGLHKRMKEFAIGRLS